MAIENDENIGNVAIESNLIMVMAMIINVKVI